MGDTFMRPKHPGAQVTVCGLIIEDRLHNQITGDTMKFITICDYTGIIECEIFANTYRAFGVVTVRYPVVEATATVEPFDNPLGCTLKVIRIGKLRHGAAGISRG